ncbi:MAG: TonB-dependent receptor domain-containing protein, partial [bacterium]
VEAIQNAANTRVYGVQFGLEWKPIKRITFSTDINYQKGEEELDNGTVSASRHAPPTFGNARINYTYDRWMLEVNTLYSASVKYNDLPEEEKTKPELYAIDGNGNTWSPSWYTINFKSMYKVHDKLNLSFGIENISDQRYRYYSSGIAAAGRNYIISLDLRI